jgi:hypothetical protein
MSRWAICPDSRRGSVGIRRKGWILYLQESRCRFGTVPTSLIAQVLLDSITTKDTLDVHHENRQFNPAPHLAWKGPHLAWNCTPSQLSCNGPQFRQYPGLTTVLNDRYPAWQEGFLTHVTAPSTNFSVIPRKEGCEIRPPL